MLNLHGKVRLPENHQARKILILNCRVLGLYAATPPFRGGLAGVFWIIVLLQNPSSLQLEVTNLPIYQSGKGYKAISKALGLPRTTVRAIIYKWRKRGTVENLPRSGRPTKITPRVQQQLIQEVTKDPTTTSKELQALLASVKVSVHDSTIRKRLGKNGFHGKTKVPRRKPLLSKKNIKAHLSFARKHLDDPQDFWENTLWTDETLNVLEGLCPITFGIKVTPHFRKRTSYQQ
ncbi:hypothetical protein QTP70_003251 [Hemibagrus guttatus]|uniref:Transposase Tc1-like domain-containing protein n=1 Tax=Hemibagrus guttatus TaxID=175788 RepID=A0AAE0URG2_9TELE|nr:hypothetical protein QTP70_003251 [Hemibagrus guttatus]